MSLRKSIGVIVGSPSTYNFEFKCFDVVRVNDFVEVFHDGRWHVLFVNSLRRDGDVIYASCTCLGKPSDTPFKAGLNVYPASEANIRSVLGLTADYSKSIYLGLLKNYNVKVYIPIDRLNRIFIVGKPGSGKSYTVGVFIEEFLKKNIPVLIIDVHGEYSSFKVAAKSGCEIFGVEPKSYIDQIVEFGDKRFSPAANIDISFLSELSVEDLVLTGKCVIINLRGIDLENQISIVASIVSKLLDAAINKKISPFYLVVDEAHRFIGREKSESQMILRRFSQEGRKFGANLIVVSQRPQLLDTTVRGLSGTWIIHRLSDPNDISIAVESGGLGRGWEDNIVWLDVGECIVTGEAVDKIPYVVRVRCRETMHGGAGFNPLDYVSEDALKSAELKWKNLMKLEYIVKPTKTLAKPKISSLITQYYLPVKFSLEYFSSNLKTRFPFKFDFSDLKLNYYPALEIKASIMVKRNKPNLEFTDEYKVFIPLVDESSELDFSPREAYYIKDFVESDLSSSSANFENVIYHSPKIDISSLNAYEKFVNDFKKFVSFKISYKIYYSTKFKIYSNYNESLESFVNRLRKISSDLFNEASLKLMNKYNEKISRHERILKNLKDEIKVKVQSAKRLLSDINELKGKIKGLDPSSREYISTNSRIQSLEEKLLKLNKMISNSNAELERREKAINELKRELNDKLKKLKSDFDDLGEIKTLSLSLNKRDVNVDFTRIIWIPIFNGGLKISNGFSERILNFEWNGYNGLGVYGRCESCNSTINGLDSLNLCSICLTVLCPEHVFECSVCGAKICSDHMFKCDICGRILCVNEKSYNCSICGAKICSNCVKYCVDCGDEIPYCSKHVSICNYCGKVYCDKHYNEHLVSCGVCGKRICGESIENCSICNKPLCNDCIIECSKCGKIVCRDHMWSCSICGVKMCINEDRHICSICGRNICSKHSYKCPSCGREVCTEHIKTCPNCGRRVCESCIITVKRLFRYKTGCRFCLKP
ncbi:MAG: DUF87 domain-containing protein [Candidatus Methanomethylicia archaeon]